MRSYKETKDSTSSSSTPFDSEGFDLDALQSDETGAGDAVLEVGGGVTVVAAAAPKEESTQSSSQLANQPSSEEDFNEIEAAEEYKLEGNNAFKAHDWTKAYDMYSRAIQATPGTTAGELCALRDAWQEEQHLAMRQRLRDQDEEERRKASERKKKDGMKTTTDSATKTSDATTDTTQSPPPRFEAPPHKYGKQLAIYHCNRSATLLQIIQEEGHQKTIENQEGSKTFTYQDAIADCDVAILWNPEYTKAYVRRAKAHEAAGDTEAALSDLKEALRLDPTNAAVRQAVKRLEKVEAERMEKLKEETMGKLKDLGNSLLSNFGLSMDNFKAVQDPTTGSYSVSFNNN